MAAGSTPGRALRRAVLELASIATAGAPFLTAIADPLRRGVHDRASGTRVVACRLAERSAGGLRTSLMRRLGLLIATCGYIGFAPVAPGTVGSAAGVALFYLIRGVEAAVGAGRCSSRVLFAAGVWAASMAEQALGGTDPGPVVIDEVVGHADHARVGCR